jgi:hypothetical protein
MKKLLFSSILLIIFNISFAQISKDNKYDNKHISQKYFGIKGGVNFAIIHGQDYIIDPEFKTSFIVGLFFEIPLSNQLIIQPELLFSMKGWKKKFTFESYDENGNYIETINTEYSRNLNYLEIPILGKITLNEINNIRPNIYFGPCFGFNVSATHTEKIVGGGTNIFSVSMEEMNILEVGLNQGIMLDLNNKFIIDCRYSISLTEIDKGGSGAKNTVLSIIIGYKF